MGHHLDLDQDLGLREVADLDQRGSRKISAEELPSRAPHYSPSPLTVFPSALRAVMPDT
jgi:hypothetical protein